VPIAIILLVGLAIFSGVNKTETSSTQEKNNKAVSVEQPEVKPLLKKPEPLKEKVKVEPTQPEPLKEEVKIEPTQPEPLKEEVKIEPTQPEPVKELVKEQSKAETTEESKAETTEESKAETRELAIEEVKVNEPESDYLKIILYIVAAIAAIFGSFYFFLNRGNSQPETSAVDSGRKDIEESYQPEPQSDTTQQPAEEEPQSDTTQQPAEEEPQSDTTQQPAEEEPQSDTTQQPVDEKDNKDK
jgi:flagellar basal body-associated protein FliL